MASFHWSIANDSIGTGAWSFEVNPLDVEGMFPERAYNRIPVLRGSPLKQFSEIDTRIRRFKFDTIPGTNTTHRDFLLGTDENDTTSILYLKKLDADGQLTVYWLKIPEELKELRPYLFRDQEWIPIRVLDVITKPPAEPGTPRWDGEMIFEIVPLDETTSVFTLGVSALGGENQLVTEALDSVYTYDLNLDTYTDRTTVSFTGGTPFPSFTVAIGDFLYFGTASPHYGLWFDIDTPETIAPDATQGATANLWEYWDGSAWQTLTVVDSTNSFINDETTITWSDPGDWTTAVLSSAVSGAPLTAALYFVRVGIGTVTTAFKFDKVWRS